MDPVDSRPLQYVRMNHGEQIREERPERFLTTRTPIGQNLKMFKQVRAPPAHVKETYPKLVAHEGDVERYGGLRFQIDEIIFAA